MSSDDGQVPTPRRAGLPLFRRPADRRPAAAPAPVPRVADLSALLSEIDALRTTLQTDLSLAAAALEAGAPDLAVELVDGDLQELRGFSSRADERLGALSGQDDAAEPAAAGPAAAVEPAVPAAVRPLRPRRRALTAAPLAVAAAALLGFTAGVVPERAVQPQPEMAMSSAAVASYELKRLAIAGASDEQLRRVAETLNDEIALLVAQAGNDPAAAQQAMLLLQTTTEVLSSQGDSSVLRGVIAEARALRERLRESLPSVAPRPVRPARPAAPAPRPVLPLLPRPEAAPEQRRSTTPEPAAATPRATPAPVASPAAPQPSPDAAPTRAPEAEPTPRPSAGSYLPGAWDLPGF